MTRKPTYEELEQRIKELEAEAVERKRAEEQIRIVRDKFEGILAAIGDGVDITTYDYKVVYANDNLKKIIGKDDLEGHLCYEVFLDRDAPCEKCPMRRAIESGRIETEEIVQPNDRIVELSASPFRLASGEMAAIEIAKDITERKRVEEELRVSERRLRGVFETMAEGVVLIARDGQIVQANRAAQGILGLSRSIIKNRNYVAPDWDIFRPDGTPMPPEDMAGPRAMKEKRPVKDVVMGIKRPDGSISWINVSAAPLMGATGELEGVVGTFIDVTELKRAEEALRAGEKKHSTLVESSLTGICIIQDGKVVFANRRFAQIYGYSRDELSGMESSRLVHPEDRAFVEGIRTKRLKGEKAPSEYEARGVRKDGETIWIVRRNTRIEYRRRPAVLGNIVDITERKRAEQQIRRLSHELLMAQERERQRISRELHDVLGQELSALSIGLGTFFDNQREASPVMRQRLSELSKIVQGAITGVRNLSHTLRSTALDQLGLVPAARLYCKKFSHKHGVKVEFSGAGINESTLDFHSKINLYRLIQEGLHNVKKHADASRVAVHLVGSFPNIILRIEDNGRGFDVQNCLITPRSDGHMGLRIMKERVALLEGEIRIASRQMRGTKILIEVPCKQKGGQKESDLDF